MKCNQISSISFKKKLMANANIVSDGKPENVGIYKLEPRKEEDRYYFERLQSEPEWRKGLFLRSLHRTMRYLGDDVHIYVMEDKNNKCLGLLEVDDDIYAQKFQDVIYLETRPDLKNEDGKGRKKYIAETLMAFATKVFDEKIKNGIIVGNPLYFARNFYIDNCGFRQDEDIQGSLHSSSLFLLKENFDNLVQKNALHTGSEIELVG